MASARSDLVIKIHLASPGDSYRDVSWLGPNVGQTAEVQLLQARKLVDCGLGRVCSRSKMRYEGINCTLHASD